MGGGRGVVGGGGHYSAYHSELPLLEYRRSTLSKYHNFFVFESFFLYFNVLNSTLLKLKLPSFVCIFFNR